MLEGAKFFDAEVKPWFGPAFGGITDRLVKLGGSVRQDVELGYHFCYGKSTHDRSSLYSTNRADCKQEIPATNTSSSQRTLAPWLVLPVRYSNSASIVSTIFICPLGQGVF